MSRHVIMYSPKGNRLEPEWADRPLPIAEPFDVWLEYPSRGVTILASVEPDALYEEFTKLGGSTFHEDGATHQYFIAYTENHQDGSTVQRSATWRFVPSRGLMLGGESDLLEEISRVGAHILDAIYRGSHEEIEDPKKFTGTVH